VTRRRDLALRGLTALAAAVALAAPATANAAEKSIWGPLTLAAGESAFPTYAQLGVDTFQMQLTWDSIARTQPANPTDPADPAYRWPAAVTTASREAAANGIRLALLVTGAPAWANGNRSRIWAPTNPADYADFITAAATRYSNVRRWMIWGEPNMAVRFQPQEADSGVSAQAYAPILDASYDALKRVSPRNIVIGGMTWTGGDVKPSQFVREMRLPDGRPPRLDWFGHNPYPYRQPLLSGVPVEGFRDISDLDTFASEIDAAYGASNPVPIWLSEFMIQSDQPSDNFTTFVTPQTQADWLTAGFRIADSFQDGRVRGVGWFTFVDQPPAALSSNWGLMTSAFEPKPAYAAFAAAPSERNAPRVSVARTARRSTLAGAGLAVRLTPRTAGLHSVQLLRGTRVLATGRTQSSRAITLRLRRTSLTAGRYLIRVTSPRGSTIVLPLKIR
jgi:hypothetical protein